MIGCLRTHVRKQPIIALYFEFENELKFYNLEAWSPASLDDCRIILHWRGYRKHVPNTKVILCMEYASQYNLVVGNFRVTIHPQPRCKFFVEALGPGEASGVL